MNASHIQLQPLLALFFFFCILTDLNVSSATCHVDDETGLLGFKSGITQDPSGMLSSWKPGTDCCTWAGINCLAGNRVTSLGLTGQPGIPNSFLSGTISPSLSKVIYLDGIYLQNLKNISGQFPDLVFGLPNLKYVYIENNKLSGQIPGNIGQLVQLEALSLAGNRFTGPIPSSISALTQLTQLKLEGNLLNGTVPVGIGHLKNLTVLTLQSNQLSGPIPDFFSSFNNLRLLSLHYNKFYGKIPSSISSLAPKLAYLELGHNELTGQIPRFLGNFKALDTLDLSWNRLSGVVPKEFANLTKIFNLDLSHNLITDPFPIMNVKGIESLDLSYNNLHLLEIPKWVTSSPIIYSLKLAKCGIKVNLHDWNPVESYFYDYIDLSDNEISGSPVRLLNRTDYLVGFWASGNKLRFNLESLRIVDTLKSLDLSHNLVFGKVPNAVSRLDEFNVSYNHLCGQIPITKFAATAFMGNDCLCGSPLAPCKV
ncbi:LRRNT_2 domain-containing protein/LRR_4 domain-containing protein/LRR_6 domain-containing protein/LRR_8 domain-containing protein [Cephalotus follicularis]|uniref:LRRNT_2 domain-containing protein/LRR_4 domain-containing protein/LRR_6 domain-containing protein/LRR_8 domain-containing protein n=1 Tax=Cephalotus follicularis TaxID=3775 RepID=A0A1Q3BNY9_CEPFO|nr:LRRNT_2 domain-containing protein/LRR_4 domain-containing protein/LRR_6 domain-containing protein/LRR_8 domain-containing protein [Cephalotus follicularis]